MQQTALSRETSPEEPLKLNGRIISLGTAKQLFHQGETEEPLSISITFSSQELTNKIIKKRSDFSRMIYTKYRSHWNTMATLTSKKSIASRITIHNTEELEGEGVVSRLIDAMSDINRSLKDKVPKSEVHDVYITDFIKQTRPFSSSDFHLSNDLLQGLVESAHNFYTISFAFSMSEGNDELSICQISLKQGNLLVADIHFIQSDTTKIGAIKSEVMKNAEQRLKPYYSSLEKCIHLNRNIFTVFKDIDENSHQISRVLSDIFDESLSELSADVEAKYLSHVSPIRAYPKRFYFSDQSLDGPFEGASMIDILKGNQSLRLKANNWLKEFGIEVGVEELREVLHRLAIRQDGVKVDLDITDVGFGVSQILPVLIGAFLTPCKGLSVVEQPEIHLHPKMQAELASFYKDIIESVGTNLENNETCRFLIETHSISFMRRIRTILKDDRNDCWRDRIAIYNINTMESGVRMVEESSISEMGDFKWPQSFLEAELDETMSFFDKF